MDFFHNVNYSVTGKYNGFTIVFFHDLNHSAFNYNYTYKNGIKSNPCYFLEYLSKISRLFIYDRPEETLRFNILRKKTTNIENYKKILKKTNLNEHCKQLRAFLKFHNILPPFVLVSHGLGSLYLLKFANLFKEDVFKIILVQPYEFTPKIGLTMLCNKQKDTDIDTLLEPVTTKNIEKIDLHCIAVPFFNIKVEKPIYAIFNVSTVDESKVKKMSEFFKKQNYKNYSESFYKDRSEFLNQTNPLGLAYKIKYAVLDKKN
tara:strand:+ start:1294 stop:2073 length:780 start_codon:yes stop_codon:yes gene_type:complete